MMPNPDQPQVDLAKAIKNMKDNWPALMEFDKLRAQQAKMRYENLRNEGFSHDDALFIVAKAY